MEQWSEKEHAPHRRCARFIAVRAAAVAVALATIGVQSASSAEGIASYGIRARFDPDTCRIEGTISIAFTNVCDVPLDRLFLNLYANRLLKPNPALNDVNYSWSYPWSFEPGYIELGQVTFSGGGYKPGACGFVAEEQRPEKTLLEIMIEPPLPPGEKLGIETTFSTRIPRKYGTFGAYSGDVLLNGGWHPYLPALDPDKGWLPRSLPPVARYDLVLEGPSGMQAVLNGQHFESAAGIRHSSDCRFLTLEFADEFHRYEASERGAKVVYFKLESGASSARMVCSEACRVFKYLDIAGFDVSGLTVTFLEGHFRTVLTDHGGCMGLLSDRLMKVLPYPIDLRAYHMREVADETLYQFFSRHTPKVESDLDWSWVAEGLAWIHLREYLTMDDEGFDEIMQIMKAFSFIPMIDQTMVAPRFPFNDVFFDTYFKSEPHRENLLRYNNRVPFGRLAIEKARDAVGDVVLLRTLKEYENWNKPLDCELDIRAGKDMGWFAAQVRGGFPVANYSIGRVKEEKLSEGRYQISVEILREGGEGFVENVELGVRDSDGGKWKGKVRISSNSTIDTFVYPASWDKIIVDPEGRVWEPKKTDNHLPKKPKLLVTAFNPRIEYELRSPFDQSVLSIELFGGFAGIFEGDYANQILLNYFFTKRGMGANLGYFRAFTMKLDSTDYREGVGINLYLERLEKDFALSYRGDEMEEGNFFITSMLIWGIFDSRIDYSNPHSGARAYAALEIAEKLFGTDFKFVRFFWDLRWITAVSREHVLAFNASGGFSWGTVPAQRRYSAGGFYGVRGIPEGEALGLQSLVMRFEYRHMVWHDLNINFLFMGYLRKVQGVFFLETGAAAGSAEELVTSSRFRSGTGYGIRVEFDSFGVRPFVVGLDVGWGLDKPGRQPVIYLTVSQSF